MVLFIPSPREIKHRLVEDQRLNRNLLWLVLVEELLNPLAAEQLYQAFDVTKLNAEV